MAKPKIFYIFKNEPLLEPTRGDRINELFFLRALAEHFTVHYNAVPFSADSTTAGDPDRPIALPAEPYDLYIVRSNADFFVRLPSPKATMAYPYDERVFACADALFSTTTRWVEFLESWNQTDDHPFATNWYPHRIVAPKKIITIGQLPSAGFSVLPADHPGVRHYRHLFTNAPFVIGFFGRLDEVEQLSVYFSAIEPLATSDPDLVTAIGTPYPWELTTTANTIHIGQVPFTDMPFAVSACDLTLAGEERDNEWLGARKVLEAVAAGTPVLTMPWAARVEQLGQDYPLYYDSPQSLADLISKYRADAAFKSSVLSHLDRLRENLSFSNMAATLAGKLRPLLGVCRT